MSRAGESGASADEILLEHGATTDTGLTRSRNEDSYLADHFLIPARVGDRLIVCTDGISGEIDDDSPAEAIRRGQGPQETADALIATALGTGGKDNATVIVSYCH
ncbi:PP2C family protein-serine/threonine phosphatase [Actinomyces gaoshouyii]|uniref:PPM-type phosphatase domain-containing protein n=1 Tax=Actinomyces gaoshouyii TaxID=1960083 RepID=A0A8H9H7K8_9ACTO|nr:hypothetical protein [Actinomyces gaoshouyii]ARD42173.1 hypothetical protein B6G06_07290 [Actinomyces gaoshouyii]GGO96355.1 hypothetical protein GCM10011612_06350 [Actinomyces gaoshouyii]